MQLDETIGIDFFPERNVSLKLLHYHTITLSPLHYHNTAPHPPHHHPPRLIPLIRACFHECTLCSHQRGWVGGLQCITSWCIPVTCSEFCPYRSIARTIYTSDSQKQSCPVSFFASSLGGLLRSLDLFWAICLHSICTNSMSLQHTSNRHQGICIISNGVDFWEICNSWYRFLVELRQQSEPSFWKKELRVKFNKILNFVASHYRKKSKVFLDFFLKKSVVKRNFVYGTLYFNFFLKMF